MISFLSNILHSQFHSYKRIFIKISIESILTKRRRRKKNPIDTIPVSSSFHLNDKSLCLFSVTTLNWNADLIVFYIAELFVWMSFLARALHSVVVYVWREPFNLMLMFGLFNNSKKRCVHTTDNTLRSTLLKPYLPSWCVVDSKPKYFFPFHSMNTNAGWCLRANYVVFIVLFCCFCCIFDSVLNEQCLKEQQINHLLRSLKTNTNCYTYFFLLCDFFYYYYFVHKIILSSCWKTNCT